MKYKHSKKKLLQGEGMEARGKARIAVIATWLLWNSALCWSSEEFSSLLNTVVGDPVTPEFHIFGRNGFCAHANSYIWVELRVCANERLAETFTFHSDGTLRIVDDKTRWKCLKATAFTEGSQLIADSCTTPPTNATLWQTLPGDRQIAHQSTGLVLTAVGSELYSRLTLESNIYSSAQTWRLDKRKVVRTAHILGMKDLCLLLSGNTHVWLGLCGTSGVDQEWLIYPDATIRPHLNSSRCLSFKNLVDRNVVVTTCGLSLTSERWVLTGNGYLLNEHTNTALDVPGANPNLNKVIVYAPASATPPDNQKWRFIYTD